MAFTTTYTSGRQEIAFSASDFLDEAISDFLESGANASRFASSIVKLATGVELLLKDLLEKICPALVLDKVDDAGLQIAKAFNLEKRLRSPKEVDNLDLRTAPFPTLMLRVGKFYDIEAYVGQLTRLHKIRNSLVHHRGKVDVLETNLLLVKYVFPFIEGIGKYDKTLGLRISSATWKKIRQLEAQSVDVLTSQLAKKIAHHSSLASRLSKQKVAVLARSEVEQGSRNETVVEDNLRCLACGNDTVSIFQDFDVDYDESGPSGGYFVFSLRCRVCGVELDEDEIRQVISNFGAYLGGDVADQQQFWEQAITPPDMDESY
jgi:hypothetical protein